MAKQRAPISGVQSDINVTPMADIMLVLLIIFMITAPMLQKGVTVNMPKTKMDKADDMPDADLKTAVVIGIDRLGRVYIGNKPLGEGWKDELTVRLKRAQDLLSDKDRVAGKNLLYLKADVSVPYKSIVEIIETVRDSESRFEKMGLLVDQKDKKEKQS